MPPRTFPPGFSLILLASLFLAACASGGDSSNGAPAPAETAVPDTAASGRATYANERFSVRYDDDAFELFQVRQALPPDYDAPVDVAKLIPADRVAQLGREACTYGERGVEETCTAEKENGLGMAVLPNGLNAVRQGFEPSLVDSVEQGGRTWIRYAMGAEGYGADYYYLALGDEATAVLFRSYGPRTGPAPADLDDLLASFEPRRSP